MGRGWAVRLSAYVARRILHAVPPVSWAAVVLGLPSYGVRRIVHARRRGCSTSSESVAPKTPKVLAR